MERVANKLCEVVLDLTQFGPSNEIPNQWISQLLQLLPFDVYDNVAMIHIYNPNSFLRKYIKKLPRPVTHKITKRINFAVILVELQEHINASEIRLPKSTSKLEVFYGILLCLTDKNMCIEQLAWKPSTVPYSSL